jgi:hypothetical protein
MRRGGETNMVGAGPRDSASMAAARTCALGMLVDELL